MLRYPRINRTYLFILIFCSIRALFAILLLHSVPLLFSDIHQSTTRSRWVITMNRRPLRTINPSCFLPTCRAVDAFILMGSPWSVLPFFMSYKATRTQRNASRFVPPPLHQFQALHPHFRRAVPPTIEMWSQKCNFFQFGKALRKNTGPFPRVEGALPMFVNIASRTLCVADKILGQFAAVL